jgi:signal transduction histidine kinase
MLLEVHHLSRLIDDLFELSQIESGALKLRLEAVPLAELVASTLAAYDARARDAAIVLEQQVSPELQPALADPTRLQRVLRNLLDNALHHTPPGGLIRVEALRSPDEPSACVRVSDSGPGVPVDERERVFERFYRGERSRQRGEGTTNRVGAGLGLAIADGLVRAQRGRIWVEPTASGGAVFAFTVPLAS